MIPSLHVVTPLTVLVVWVAPLAQAVPKNITFDDNAPEITYNGFWARVPAGIGGYHHETIHKDAFATIQLPRKCIPANTNGNSS
jgi:hypothetical protein